MTPFHRDLQVGVVALSSVVPQIELKLGTEKLKEMGFSVRIHPHSRKRHLFFSGKDPERAEAFLDYAWNDQISVIWCARGGHGVIRILPLLEEAVKTRGIPPKKLLVGYSDVTGLMEYVRREWGWATLHAPMPCYRKFSILNPVDLRAMTDWVSGQHTIAPWSKKRLSFWTAPPAAEIEGPLVGGNLVVWNCLVGTRFESSAQSSILFLEDVDESLYRIDRALCQLALSRGIEGVKAVVLGNFLNCKDHAPSILKAMPRPSVRKRVLLSPKPHELKPLRKVFGEKAMLKKIFKEWGERLNIPVAYGLPVGHGPEVSPLPIGARYQLTPAGELTLREWDWLKK